MTRFLPTVFITALVYLPVIASADLPATLKGQLWTNLTIGDNPAPDYARHEELVGYIPTFSLARELPGGALIDLEWAYRAGWATTGNDSTITSGSHHRLWARYSGESLELRLGLQKIAFGPGLVLRPLAWFDTIDPKDPTNQTDGVEAFRARWFATDNLALWGWLVSDGDMDEVSPGGRIELSHPLADLGFTWHWNRTTGFGQLGMLPARLESPEWRLGWDLRFDRSIGFWTEGVLAYPVEPATVGPAYQHVLMLGGDYTFALGNGLYVMVEHLSLRPLRWPLSNQGQVSALLASMPLGIMDQLMVIVQIDWESRQAFNYLRWARAWDTISLNVMLQANPRRKSFDWPPESLPTGLAGFGAGLQIMVVYNH
ncbi:MAG: hypothetical protein V3W14_12970 [Candidatus Neomarinimicrobiota bacterium]